MLHFGNEKSLNGLTTASSFLGPLMRRGTAKHSRQEIQDLLDKYTSSLSFSSGTGNLSLSWQSKRDQLGNVLDLLEEILRQPTFPEKEFDELRQCHPAISGEKTDRSAIPGRQRHAAASSIRIPRPISAISPRFRRKSTASTRPRWPTWCGIFKEQLGGQTGELVLIGDFDVDSTLKRLDAIFAGWKTTVPYERITRTANAKIPGSTENILTPDKKAAIYLAALTLPYKDTAPDYPGPGHGQFPARRQLHVTSRRQAASERRPVLWRRLHLRADAAGPLCVVRDIRHLQP